MFSNVIKQRWAEGEVAYGGWTITGASFAVEMFAREGFTYVCLDLQHGLLGYETFLAAIYTVPGSRCTPVVRVPNLESGLVGKVLDAGAEAVIVPMVETAAEAEQAVRACRYAPQGVRSVGASRGGYRFGTDPERVNSEVLCLVMIETAKGVDNAEAICSVPGVDGIYVGPGDLALSMGLRPTVVPQPGAHADAIEHVRKCCETNHIGAGIQCHTAEQAKERADHGFNMVTVTTDAYLLRNGMQKYLAELGLTAAPIETGAYSN
jgi:4-hydroxy-2-oxoheptanedioate aldolase